MSEFRIYVADLAAYNEGTLRGGWIDCEGKTADELRDEIKTRELVGYNEHCLSEVFKRESIPGLTNAQVELAYKQLGKPLPEMNEYAIHDHEGFGDLIGEYTSLDRVAEIVERAEELGDNWEAYKAYWNYVGGSEMPDVDDFEDAYCGEWSSEEQYAENLFDDCYLSEVPEHVQAYIDYDKFTRDLFMSDCFSEDCPNGGIYVFRNV